MGQQSKPRGYVFHPRRSFALTSTVSVGRGKVLPEATILPVSSVLAGCRLVRCCWHERGQPTNTNRTGLRHRHTQRYILTDHAEQSSTQEHSGDATRSSERIVQVVYFLHAALCSPSAGCCRGSRQIELLASGHAKVKVGRFDEYLKNKCKMHLVSLNLTRQLLHRRTVAVPEPATKRQP